LSQPFVEGDLVLLELAEQLIDQVEEKLSIVVVGDDLVLGREEVQGREPSGQLVFQAEQFRGFAATSVSGEGDLGEPALLGVISLQFGSHHPQVDGAPPVRHVHVATVAGCERLELDRAADISESFRAFESLHGCPPLHGIPTGDRPCGWSPPSL
jgi:hypothetical protein